jgi:hypothetical protein
MCRRLWNKMVLVSVALAAAGTLVCVTALIGTAVPKGSAWGFAAEVVASGVAIALVVAGYVWVCDKCEQYLSGRTERLLNVAERPRRRTTSEVKNEKPSLSDADRLIAARRLPQPGPSAAHYVGALRGFAKPNAESPKAESAKQWWHGQ